MTLHHLLSATDLSRDDLDRYLSLAQFFHTHHLSGTSNWTIATGKILASLFFESSTRTRFSFEAAMYRLGGHVMSLEDGSSSSVKKGETLSDMGQIISGYADIVIVRHPKAQSVSEFSSRSTIPVINAGDGPNQHPSQSILDIYAIHKLQGCIDGLHIGVVGDLKYGRTVNSLLHLLSGYTNLTFYLISDPELGLDTGLKHLLTAAGHTVFESDNLEANIAHLDVLYMTRVQEERFATPDSYHRVKDKAELRLNQLIHAKPNLSILHPLPRVTEIATDVDSHPAAHYFDQAKWGLFVRMGIIVASLFPEFEV